MTEPEPEDAMPKARMTQLRLRYLEEWGLPSLVLRSNTGYGVEKVELLEHVARALQGIVGRRNSAIG